MPGQLVFRIEDLIPIIAHAKASTEFRWDFGHVDRKTSPCLVLAKDHGCYLMSGGEPGLIINATSLNGKHTIKKHVCAYAKGMDPVVDQEDAWGNAQAVCGGDDFGESIDLKIFEAVIERCRKNNRPTFVIEISDDKFDFKIGKAPRKPRMDQTSVGEGWTTELHKKWLDAIGKKEEDHTEYNHNVYH